MDEFQIRVVPKPWNKGKLVGQKAPFKLKEIWAIRVRLQIFCRARVLALFDLGIDSKLRACDLLKLKVRDVCHGERIAARAIVVQQKTTKPVQFEITEPTRTALADWIARSGLASDDFLFPSRVPASTHLSTRQYARIVDSWVREIGLDPAAYGTHSMRRTKPSLIYRRTKNLRAVQLLLETASYCPRTLDRGQGLLSVSPALWGGGCDQAAIEPLRRVSGRHRAARRIACSIAGVDAAGGGGAFGIAPRATFSS
jgi:hypothetical protein